MRFVSKSNISMTLFSVIINKIKRASTTYIAYNYSRFLHTIRDGHKCLILYCTYARVILIVYL